MGDKKRKILLTLCIVGVLGSVAAFGTYSAFTGTTTNSGNSFAAGTVSIQDDSGLVDGALQRRDQPGAEPTTERCIRVQVHRLAAGDRAHVHPVGRERQQVPARRSSAGPG